MPSGLEGVTFPLFMLSHAKYGKISPLALIIPRSIGDKPHPWSNLRILTLQLEWISAFTAAPCGSVSGLNSIPHSTSPSWSSSES